MNKRERQQKILDLIRAKPIGTQEDLRALLERTGVAATQSSVSRDLEELGVVKHHGHYTLPRTNGNAVRGLLSLDQAGDNLPDRRRISRAPLDSTRAKTEKLRALRLAKEAAELAAPKPPTKAKAKSKTAKKKKVDDGKLSDWLEDQTDSGRNT